MASTSSSLKEMSSERQSRFSKGNKHIFTYIPWETCLAHTIFLEKIFFYTKQITKGLSYG